jgi:hypothetical protein
MSRAQFGRIERGEIANLSVDQLCRAAAAVGLKVALRTFPDGDPARDAGQWRSWTDFGSASQAARSGERKSRF